jgi:hypothetical protein
MKLAVSHQPSAISRESLVARNSSLVAVML